VEADVGVQSAMTSAAASRSARPFEAPERYGWGFNPTTGGLTFFTPASIRTYRPDPPMCWYRSRDQPQWRGSHGGDFELDQLVEAAGRLPLRMDLAGRWGMRVGRRPGIAAFASFHDRLDPEAVALASPVGRESWLLYCLLFRAPQLRELAADDLGLAMLIAARRRAAKWRFARVRLWARKKRTDILAACGLPPQKQWLKLLRRIPNEALSEATVDRVATLAREQPDTIVRLRHLPRVNAGVLGLLAPEYGRHVADSLLREVGGLRLEDHRGRWWHTGVLGTLHDTVAMAHAMEQPLPLLRSVEQLGEAHDDLVALTLQREPGRVRPFGPPPIPETDDIVALRSPLDLRDEAEHQRNCLAWDFWADACYAGEMYVYRITKPERASVAIERRPGGRWRINELKGRFNRAPQPATVGAVRAWLAGAVEVASSA